MKNASYDVITPLRLPINNTFLYERGLGRHTAFVEISQVLQNHTYDHLYSVSSVLIEVIGCEEY